MRIFFFLGTEFSVSFIASYVLVSYNSYLCASSVFAYLLQTHLYLASRTSETHTFYTNLTGLALSSQ